MTGLTILARDRALEYAWKGALGGLLLALIITNGILAYRGILWDTLPPLIIVLMNVVEAAIFSILGAIVGALIGLCTLHAGSQTRVYKVFSFVSLLVSIVLIERGLLYDIPFDMDSMLVIATNFMCGLAMLSFASAPDHFEEEEATAEVATA